MNPSLLLALLVAALPAADEAELEVLVAPGDEWIERSAPVELTLNRPIGSDRLALVIGQTDVSDLLRVDGERLTYRSDALPLPSGEQELVLYRVAPGGEWVEIHRSSLRVRHRGGFEDVTSTTGIDLQGLWLADESSDESTPDDGATAQITLGGSLGRNGWTATAELGVLAVSEIERALRFGDVGEEADRADLSSYSLRIEKGSAFAALGDVSFGEHRHLADAFSSRGLALGLPLGKGVSLRAAAVNGSSLVGWSNILGLDRREHRIVSGALGVEILRQRPGGLRLDADVLDGSILPINDFNQGAVNDAEEMNGWGLRLAGSSASDRVRFQLGWSRSEFENPFDPLLSQGTELVVVAPETREARYAHLDLALVDGKELAEGWSATVRLGLRHERVDPQYRSVAAFTQADLERNGAELQASVGSISAQVGHVRSEDNLDEVPSILKTKTRSSSGSVSVPLGMVFDETPRPWLPSVQITSERTRQVGANTPVDGGFSPSHIPNQISENHSFGLDWSGNRWQAGAMVTATDQDNRQPGRERDDFTNVGHTFRVSVSPHAKVDLGVEQSRNRAASLGPDRVERNERLGLNLLWRIHRALTLTGDVSRNETEDEPRTATAETDIVNLELAYRFQWREQLEHGGSGQFFFRYSSQDFESFDGLFGGFMVRDSWTLHAGFNLSLR